MSSMTQEEIEALMNSTALENEAEQEEPQAEESIDDILSQIDGVVDDGDSAQEPSLEVNEEESNDIDEILAGIDGIEDADNDAPQEEASVENQDIDSILASIDGVVDDGSSEQMEEVAQDVAQETSSDSSDDTYKADLDSKIEQGIYPMPVEREHKVVNQLSQVAEDSEAKASQIFDVLSFILDENDVIGRNLSSSSEFITSQVVLLERLAQKFPNIEIFEEQLLKAQDAKSAIEGVESIINDENGKLFEAMELMQFHDINRQKIERVMSVIRKLSNYLNGLFEDDGKPEVQIAKHISGDGNETVTADDLDSLIAEYSKEQ